jgi:hypothetical protein
MNRVFAAMPRVSVAAFSVDDALDAHEVPMDDERTEILAATRLSLQELMIEMGYEYGPALGVHIASEMHRLILRPKEKKELEIILAQNARKDIQ